MSVQAMQRLNISTKGISDILLKDPIEGEEVLLEITAFFHCDSIWQGVDKAPGTFIVTNERIGFFGKDVKDYYINFVTMIRDCTINSKEKFLRFVWADVDPSNDEKIWVELEDIDVLYNVLTHIHSIRYEEPLHILLDSLKHAYGHVQKGNLEKALPLMQKLSDEDPMCGMIDLMLARTLNVLGKSNQAVVHIAQQIPYLLDFAPEMILKEYLWYEWHEGSLRYISHLNAEDESQSVVSRYLLKAIYAKANHQLGEVVENTCLAVHELAKDDPSIYLRIFEVFAKVVGISEKENVQSIKKMKASLINQIQQGTFAQEEIVRITKMLEGLVQAIDHFESFDLDQYMEQFFDLEQSSVEDLCTYYLIKEDFERLKNLNSRSSATEGIPEYWTTSQFLSLGDVWSRVEPAAKLNIDIHILFAYWRLGKISPAQVAELSKQWENPQVFKRLREREIPTSTSLFLYHILKIECNLQQEQYEQALYLITQWQKDQLYQIGQSTDPIIQHMDSILGVLEGIALATVSSIEENLSRIPKKNPLLWIHKIGAEWTRKYKDNESQLSTSSEFVLESLRETIRQMERALNGNEKHSNMEKEIEQYREYVKIKLRELDAIQKEEFVEPQPDVPIQREEISWFRRLFGSKVSNLQKETSVFNRNPNLLRIALVGETSTGKTTLLNTIFKTNIFFVTEEEATGVATEIYKGQQMKIEVWDKAGRLREHMLVNEEWISKDGSHMDEIHIQQVRDFISTYTKVGSPALEWVEVVRVYIPLKELPNHVVLIDSPGFNANEVRTEAAKRVVENSHISLFLIDARNALKGKELNTLEHVREEVGKIFILLNKMDLVFGDNDLDCDGENAAEEMIERVRRDLGRSLKVEQVIVYPVCSLSKEEVSKDTLRYVDNLQSLMTKVFDEANAQKMDLLVDALTKESIAMSNNVLAEIQQQIQIDQKQLRKVQQAVPPSFELFEEEVRSKLRESFKRNRGRYIESMEQSLDSHFRTSVDGFASWLRGVTSNSTLKNEVESRAENYLRLAVTQIEKDRAKELDRMVQRVKEDLVSMFEELYSNLPFKSSVNPSQILRSLPDLQSALKKNMGEGFNSIDFGDGLNAGSAIGAVIGAAILGPIGLLLGGFLGNLFGGKSMGDVKQEIFETYCDAIDELYQNMIDLCNKDLNMNNLGSFVNSLNSAAQEQILRYQKTIDDEIQRQQQSINAVEKGIIQMKLVSANATRMVTQFKKWRFERKAVIV